MAAATAITRVHQILLGRINVALAPFGITFARFEVLALLHFSRRGSLPLGKIGERLQVHAASVTNAIDRLEQDGLVRRVQHPGDGRAVLAVISDQGRSVAVEAAQVLGAIEFGLAGDHRVDTIEVERLLRPVRRNAGDF
ncbi:MAG: MarR family transcriptional regulator [Actinomycetota bacterium]